MHRRIISSSTSVGSYPEPTASECVPTLTIMSTAGRTSIVLAISTVPSGTRYVIIVQPNSAPTEQPIDFSSNYTATMNYVTSTDLVGGNGTARVVIDSNLTGNYISIGGLSAMTTYYFRLYSYKANANNDYNTRNYNTVDFRAVSARTSR